MGSSSTDRLTVGGVYVLSEVVSSRLLGVSTLVRVDTWVSYNDNKIWYFKIPSNNVCTPLTIWWMGEGYKRDGIMSLIEETENE